MDFTPIVEHLSGLTGVILVGVIGLGVEVLRRYLKEKLGVDIDVQKITPAIEKKLKAKRKEYMEKFSGVMTVELENQLISEITNDLILQVPESLKKAGYTKDKARKLLDEELVRNTVRGILRDDV